MVSEAIALLGLIVFAGLGIMFASGTILLARRDKYPDTFVGFVITFIFFTAAFFLAKYLGV